VRVGCPTAHEVAGCSGWMLEQTSPWSKPEESDELAVYDKASIIVADSKKGW